ncbi:MAG: hypothetical protein DRJ10_00210 [Bacteroidetes bacterium]|nr:MAG: hypothetical protein DRJ10_00210 [Bacteroidota bacterium]
MLMDVEVYYVLKDSFLGNRTKCRVLLKIPKENNKVFNTGESIILCMKNEGGVLKFTHTFNGQKKDDEYYLKTNVVGVFKNNEVSLEPHFSPININKELLDNTDYKKGKTVILSIKVKSNRKEYIEYIDAQFKDIKYEEPIRVK